MRPNHRTWRVRGVTPDFDKERLADVLRRHPTLYCSNEIVANVADDNIDNGAWVHTLAPDLNLCSQVATIRFRYLPTQLGMLERNGQLTIDIYIALENARAGVKQRDPLQTRLSIDQHFNGITVLSSPLAKEHYIDVLAVSGLGSHPLDRSYTREMDICG